jgi:hypothetical protein
MLLYVSCMSTKARKNNEQGPTNLIERDRRPLILIAHAAGISIETVMQAKRHNKWPAQYRTRVGLQSALGVSVEQVAP